MSLNENKIVSIYAVPESQEKIFIFSPKTAVCVETKDISLQNRATSGSKLININDTNIMIM